MATTEAKLILIPKSTTPSERLDHELIKSYEVMKALTNLCRRRNLGRKVKCRQCHVREFCQPEWLQRFGD